MSKSSGRLHQSTAVAMNNQRNLQLLHDLVGKRLDGDFSSQGKSSAVFLDQISPNMIAKHNSFSRIKSTTDGVSLRHKKMDAILS